MSDIIGSSGSDVIVGTSKSDTVSAGDGNDIVTTKSGNDLVAGGSGNDTVDAGSGNDIIAGDAESIYKMRIGTSSNLSISNFNSLWGINQGIEILARNILSDGTLSAASAANVGIYKDGIGASSESALRPTIDQETGYDPVHKVSEEMVFLFHRDVLSATVGLSKFYSSCSRADYHQSEAGAWTAYHNGVKVAEGVFSADGSDGKFDLFITAGVVFDELVLKAIPYDNPNTAGIDNSQTISDDSSDFLVQYIDLVVASSIASSEGNDILKGGNGDDLIFGNGGNDVLYGGNAQDVLVGGLGDDVLYGDDGNDALYGNEGDDRLFGGNGGDQFYDGAGSDLAVGGNAKDEFHHYLTENVGSSDQLNGGRGIDALHLYGTEAQRITLQSGMTAFATWDKSVEFDFSVFVPWVNLKLINIEHLDFNLIENQAPTAVSDSGSGSEGNESVSSVPIVGNVLSNDVDADTPSSFFIVSTPGTYVGLYGTLMIAADGSYSYSIDDSNPIVDALNVGDSLVDVFNYTMSDGDPADPKTSSSTLSITINGTNDAPVASDDYLIFADTEYGFNSVNLLSNDTDPEPMDTKMIVLVSSAMLAISGSGIGSLVVSPALVVTRELDVNLSPSEAAKFYVTVQVPYSNDPPDQLNTSNIAELIIYENGDVVFNANEALDYIPAGESVFISGLSYTMQDALGKISSANISVVINGQDNTDVLVAPSSVGGTLSGGQFNDLFFSGPGDDVISGGNNIDTLSYEYALAGVTVDLSLSTPQNTIGAGIDTISSVEILIGSNFNDTLKDSPTATSVIEGLGGDDLIIAGSSDVISYLHAPSGVVVSLAIFGPQNTIGAGVDTLQVSGTVNLQGSNFDDTLRADNTANTNTLEGMGGNDTLIGILNGNDFVSYEHAPAAVTINLGISGPQDTSSQGFDTIVNIFRVRGSIYGDILIGGSNTDFLLGIDGDDQLYGGAGNDFLVGGLGNDYYDGGLGIDTANYSAVMAGILIDLNSSIQNTLDGVDTLVSIENVFGTSYSDTLIGDSNSNNLNGFGGDDFIYGNGGNDILAGGPGNDYLDGGAGIDTVDYSTNVSSGVTINLNIIGAQNTIGQGIDTLVSIENITGSLLSDTLIGNANSNVLIGGTGSDTLQAGLGSDVYTGGFAADIFLNSVIPSVIGERDVITDFTLAGFNGPDILRFTDVFESDAVPGISEGDLDAIATFTSGALGGGAAADTLVTFSTGYQLQLNDITITSFTSIATNVDFA